MRVLVEQTRDNAIIWLRRLNLLGEEEIPEGEGRNERIKVYMPSWEDSAKIAITILMGGEDADEWDLFPERDAIIIGSQDMLLSRALNRGYGMSRYRWPMHFGLLNNDCLWVMDEVQLMGAGLPTSLQLDAFRRSFGNMNDSRTAWMSATISPSWLQTVDHSRLIGQDETLRLSDADKSHEEIRSRLTCSKKLRKAASNGADAKLFADEILGVHESGTRTLVIINTVKRAVELYAQLKKRNAPELILIHSRFRQPDRKIAVERMLHPPGNDGSIVISTQVVEAGVDVSARTLITELAPWPSLVQRFGRCNRYGEFSEAEILWVDLTASGIADSALPYLEDELRQSKELLSCIDDVSPSSLPSFSSELKQRQVIRQKDLLELFDTTLDLAGHDVDVSRFIREVDLPDISVFWREIPEDGPQPDEHRPSRNEICPAGIADVKNLVKRGLEAWTWDALEGDWSKVNWDMIYPGMTLMLRSSAGLYSPQEGWSPKMKGAVHPMVERDTASADDYDGDESAMRRWMTIAEHTDAVFREASQIVNDVSLPESLRNAVLSAARWHDAGKAHLSFQAKIKLEKMGEAPALPVAKAPNDAWLKSRIAQGDEGWMIRRKHFRHELVSGLMAISNGQEDLTAYLATAHHGKVRLSIRSMPGEFKPLADGIRFARGVWDGDEIPDTDLGAGVTALRTKVDLSLMELGDGERGPSWLARMLQLRDRADLGPFRMAFLEAVIRAADQRASAGGQL